MKKKQNLSRITIDIPEEEHKQFKATAAHLGKSMRALIIDSIQEHIAINSLKKSSVMCEK